jgi:hypothetical protein
LGTQLNEAYSDVPSNTVKLGIAPYSDDLAAKLRDHYGDAVSVYYAGPGETTGCSTRDNCPGPPLRAGIRLYDPGCTTAFLGRYNTYDVILSAGHCANLVPAGHIYQHPDGVTIGGSGNGQMLKEVYYSGSKADAMVIRIGSGYRSNYIYYTAGSSFPVFALQQRSQEVGGMVVCQSSRVSGYTCGSLYAWDFSITYKDGTTLYNQRSATYVVNDGDSGGPVFYSNTAYGIQSGRNDPGRAIYSHITHVVALIGMTVNQ